MTDRELLLKYAAGDDQTAFAELARRHGAWVYCCAKRLMRREDLAEDVAQGVFILLARKARQINSESHLAGWLFRATQYCAREAMRGEARRQKHEREAAMWQQMAAGEEGADWEEIWPVLDDAVQKLRPGDREAVLLRFYQGMSVSELAVAIGTGEEAAKKRVQRAVGKLRGMLAKKGVTAGVAALGVVMAEKVTAAAPVGLVDAVTATVAGGGTGSAGVIAKGAITMMTWKKTRVAAGIAVGLLLAGGGGWIAVGRASPPSPSPVPRVTTPATVEAATAAEAQPAIAIVEPEVRALIPLIREGESLYDELELSFRRTVRSTAMQMESTVRLVTQRSRWYAERREAYTDAHGPSSSLTVESWDGRYSRWVMEYPDKNDRLALISDGPRPGSDPAGPRLPFLLFCGHTQRPLADQLESGLLNELPGWTLHVSRIADAAEDGRQCARVQADFDFAGPPQLHITYTWWLRRDAHYLPVRLEVIQTEKNKPAIRTRLVEGRELHEIAPGIFFPREIREIRVDESGRGQTEHWSFDEVIYRSSHPAEKFTVLAIPPGVPLEARRGTQVLKREPVGEHWNLAAARDLLENAGKMDHPTGAAVTKAHALDGHEVE